MLQVINASFTVKELDKIAEIYCRFTRAPAPFKKSDKKATKCNVLSALFGDKSSIEVKKLVRKTVVQLKSLAKQHIMKPD